MREVIYRLAAGEDVPLSSLFAVLSVLQLQLRLESTGMPSLEQVQARFGVDTDEDEVDAVRQDSEPGRVHQRGGLVASCSRPRPTTSQATHRPCACDSLLLR